MANGTAAMRLRVVLVVLLPALFALLPALGAGSPLGLASAMTAGLAAAVVAAVVVVRIVPPAGAAQVHTMSLREQAWQAGFLRLRDPDAAGRPRPRAPGARSAAA